jgi:hypothetical protein
MTCIRSVIQKSVSFEYLSDRTKQTIINPVYVRRKPNKGLKIGGKVVGRASVNRRNFVETREKSSFVK